MAVIAGRPKRGALLPGRLAAVTNSRLGSLAVYVFRRILWMIPVVFFVIVITFALMHSAQGSPWDKAGGRQLSQVVVDNLNKKYGLDKPVYEQFLLYIWNVVHFDFGLSYQYQGKSVVDLIGGGWGYTAIIGTLAFLMIVPIGIGLGILAALRQNTKVDYSTVGFATFSASFPNFVIGSLMIVFLMLLYPELTTRELVGTDLVQAVPLVGSAAIGHLLFGDFKLGLTTSLLIGSVPGVFFGARLSARASLPWLRPALAVILIVSGAKLLGAGNVELAAVFVGSVAAGFVIWMVRRAWRSGRRGVEAPGPAQAPVGQQ